MIGLVTVAHADHLADDGLLRGDRQEKECDEQRRRDGSPNFPVLSSASSVISPALLSSQVWRRHSSPAPP
jgi:hypothetical protein